ncbi:hypothetical protein ACF8D3_03860 [Acinetobacter sp. YQ_14]|uniref:hypothetical protein n=1 Tax=Acinetobacter sp. YQ_14 TaxID=3367236 RepID=UPI00370B68AE
MNLEQLLKQLNPTPIADLTLPRYLFGSFRRKSISFYNGLTDENTIVYWFQSKSFSIDLRLPDGNQTALHERQGWIGSTIWDSQTALLSWEIQQSYQNHIQWPEPAKLYPIGNSILEFAPSNAYVEDWRQQANKGLFFGLRLFQIQCLKTEQIYPVDGGLVITDQHIAYAQSRFPQIQQQINQYATLAEVHDLKSEIESYEVSIALNGSNICWSTQSTQIDQNILLDHFELLEDQTITQLKMIGDDKYLLYFKLDVYQPDFVFDHISACSDSGQQWLAQEQNHLLKHAQTTI